MKLFLVHCGFYDRESFTGIFEAHVDFFVVASDFQDAKARAKRHPEFRRRKMHVDGLLLVEAVDGYRIAVEEDASLAGKTITPRTEESWSELNKVAGKTSGGDGGAG